MIFLRRLLKLFLSHIWSAFKRERALGKWSVMLLFARARRMTAAAAGLPQCRATGIIQEHGKAFPSCTQTGARGELKFPDSARCLTDRSGPPPETRWQQTRSCVHIGRDVWPEARSRSLSQAVSCSLSASWHTRQKELSALMGTCILDDRPLR